MPESHANYDLWNCITNKTFIYVKLWNLGELSTTWLIKTKIEIKQTSIVHKQDRVYKTTFFFYKVTRYRWLCNFIKTIDCNCNISYSLGTARNPRNHRTSYHLIICFISYHLLWFTVPSWNQFEYNKLYCWHKLNESHYSRSK